MDQAVSIVVAVISHLLCPILHFTCLCNNNSATCIVTACEPLVFFFAGDPFVWFEIHRKRCRLWFECKSQDGLHIAKREVMSAIDSFVSIF